MLRLRSPARAVDEPGVELLQPIREHHRHARRLLGCATRSFGPLDVHTHAEYPWRYFNHACLFDEGSDLRPADRRQLAREALRSMEREKRLPCMELEQPTGRSHRRLRLPHASGWVRIARAEGLRPVDELLVMAQLVPSRRAHAEVDPRAEIVSMPNDQLSRQAQLHQAGFEMKSDASGALHVRLISTNLAGGVEYLWALWEGEPAGSAALFRAGRTMEIFALSVIPERRRIGLGSALLRAALRRAAELGCGSIYLQAETGSPAVHVYEREGFKVLWRLVTYGRGQF